MTGRVYVVVVVVYVRTGDVNGVGTKTEVVGVADVAETEFGGWLLAEVEASFLMPDRLELRGRRPNWMPLCRRVKSLNRRSALLTRKAI